MMNVFEEVRKKAEPLMESYQSDLLVHDRKFIEEYPKIPFLHFTGESGTYLVGLFKSEDYPAKGELVPHFFGHASREEILKGNGAVVPTMKTRYGRDRLCLFYDGIGVREISYEKASEIFDKYANAMLAKWRKER